MTNKRILIVDDKEENLYLLHALLQGNGYTVDEAHHGAEALDSARQNPPDLIITDILMPVMDGFSLCREWMKDERLKPIPFVFYTATYTDERDRKFALSLGAERFIVKPEEPDAFMVIIRETIEQSGNLLAGQTEPEEETVYLKQYNETLIRRIEAKMEQLERTNRELQQVIAARQVAEAALRESETLYRTLIESSEDTIHVKDRERRYVLANSRLAYHLGRDKAEIIGKRAEDLYPPEVADRILAADEQVLRTGASVEMEENLTWVGGQRVLLTRKVPLRGAQGEINGIVTISRDITERKRLEAQFLQAQKMEAVGRLAGGVAHDFNNLLTVIQGHAQFALDTLGEACEAHEDLVEVLGAAQRAASLTRQLLVFSRRQVLEPRVLDLNQVLRDMAKMLSRLIGENIALDLRLAEPLASVKADPGQMEQVVVNLVVNSRDAMPQGGKLTIETSDIALDALVAQRLGVPEGQYIALKVSDTGCGMSQEAKAHLFEPFFTTKSPGKGTGLGLATVYGIVQQSQGAIQMESEPGQGTTFRIYLPCSLQTYQVQDIQMTPDVLPQGTETILVVEDEAMVRQLTVRILRSLGYCVLEASRPEDVVHLLDARKEPIQLLLSDVMMPGMSGPELMDHLFAAREHEGRIIKTRVLYMTGYTDEAVVKATSFPTEAAVLRKPFTAIQLARKVREMLDANEVAEAGVSA